MAFGRNEIRIGVTADTSDARRGLKGISDDARNMGDQMNTAGRTSVASLRGIVTGVVAIGAARGLFDMAMSAGRAASAVQTTAKIFGDSAGIIGAAADDSAERWGLSETAFRQSASTIGSFLQNYGQSAEEAALSTVELTDRATDMAAAFGEDVGTAISAIAAALRGERDPIERFGVAIKQVDIDARLAAQGLGDLEGAQKKTAQSNATIGLIFEQTEAIVGTFADSATRDVAVFQATVQDLKEEIGAGLVPVMQNLAESGVAVAEGISTATAAFHEFDDAIGGGVGQSLLMFPALQRLASEGALVAKATFLASTQFGDFSKWLSKAADEAARTATIANSLETAVRSSGHGAVAAAAGLRQYTQAMITARFESNIFTQVNTATSLSILDLEHSTNAWTLDLVSLGETLDRTTVSTGGAAGAARGLTEAYEDLDDATRAAIAAQEEFDALVGAGAGGDTIAAALEKRERAELNQRAAILALSVAEQRLRDVREDPGATAAEIEEANRRVLDLRADPESTAAEIERAVQRLLDLRADRGATEAEIEGAEIAVERARNRIEDTNRAIAESITDLGRILEGIAAATDRLAQSGPTVIQVVLDGQVLAEALAAANINNGQSLS